MTLPLSNLAVGFSIVSGQTSATVPATVLPAYVPGSPSFPTEITLPSDPQTFATLLAIPGEGIPTAAQGTRDDAVLGTLSYDLTEKTTKPAEILRTLVNTLTEDAIIAGFSDWYVNKIWVAPVPIAFGSIVSVTDISVEVLNTWRYENRTFQSIDISELGLGVSLPDNPTPIVMQPQSDVSYITRAVIDGPPRIDGNTILNFDNITIPILTTGIRLILFWYPPEQPINEKLTWRTDILKARDGNEQRHSLRTTPRQLITLTIANEDGAEMAALRNTLLVFRGFTFGLPIWWEEQIVTNAISSGATVLPVNTIGVDHRNGAAIIVYEPASRTFTDHVIASFTDTAITITSATSANISAEALILPVRFVQITKDPGFQDQRTGWLTTILQFETQDNADLAYVDQTALEVDWQVHPEDSIVILSDCNVMKAQQARAMKTEVTREDPGIGKPLQLQRYPTTEITGRKNTVDLLSLIEIRRYRALLHWLRGSWGQCYIPTFRNDLPIALSFTLNASAIVIENVKLVDLQAFLSPHTSIMLELNDGSQYFAEVASVVELSDTQEQLNLTNPLDAMDATAITAGDGRISWLELCRVDGDAATFTHRFAGLASLSFNYKALQR